MNNAPNLERALENVLDPIRNWAPDCRRFAEYYISTVETFTSEDMREAYALTDNPKPVEPRVWGAVMRELARKRRIIPCGWELAKNPISHGRPLRVWRVIG